MRIVFLVHRFWPAVGGVEKYIHELARTLVDFGHPVTVVAGAHEPGLEAHENRCGYAIKRFPAYRSTARAWWHLLNMRQTFARADVVHISDVLMAEQYFAAVAWSIPRRPVFITRHGLSYKCPVPEREKRRAARTAKHVDGIVDDGFFISKWLGLPTGIVLDQGLSPTAEELPVVSEPESNSAVFVGRLGWDSGINKYVDAIASLKEKHNHTLPLDVYGDGPLRPSLESQATALRLPIRFHGWVPDAQERLTDGVFAFVSGRLAIQEAMARQRLVVATWVNDLKRDYVREEPFSPYIVTAGTPDEIAEHVASYINNPAKRRTMVESAFEHACTLNWRRTANEYLALWRTKANVEPAAPNGWQRAALAVDMGLDFA